MTAPAPPAAEPHVRAILALLTAGLPAAIRVALGRAPQKVPPPYVVLYPDAGDVIDTRLCGTRSRIDVHLMLHAVAAGPEQAVWAGDQARAVLLGPPPAVTGRRVRRLVQVLGSAPLMRDDDVNPPLYVQPAQYRITSDPCEPLIAGRTA